MARRSLKGHIAACSTGFLRLLNILVALAAVPVIVVTFVMRPSPTPAGWGVIIVGILALLAGLIGTCTVNQPGCFLFHLLFVLLSTAGLISFAIIIFVNTSRMIEILDPTITNPPPDSMVKAVGITCVAIVAIQLIILVLGCMVNTCGLSDYYEDLEAQGPSAAELARQQREDDRRRSKIEATSAHQLAVKMKEKYGQFQT